MKQMTAFTWCAASLVALFLVGCAAARKTGAYAAMPFAAIGDSVMLPFQGMGRASSALIELGDDHLVDVHQANKGKATIPLAELTTGLYYVPGYAMWPFDACMPAKLYPMTKACAAVVDANSTRTNKVSRATAAPQGQFKEW